MKSPFPASLYFSFFFFYPWRWLGDLRFHVAIPVLHLLWSPCGSVDSALTLHESSCEDDLHENHSHSRNKQKDTYLVQTLTADTAGTRPQVPNRRSEIRDMAERWNFGQRREGPASPALSDAVLQRCLYTLSPSCLETIVSTWSCSSSTCSNLQTIPLLLPRLGTSAQAFSNKTHWLPPFLGQQLLTKFCYLWLSHCLDAGMEESLSFSTFNETETFQRP